jgi:glucan phosphoethanolaminetransferase (alkaline phosphatase superfamily)
VISKTTLSLLGSAYLFALNLFSNQNVNQILMAIWPALLMLAVFLVIGLLHRFVLKLFLSVNIIIASMTIFFKWQYGVTITEDILLSGLINDVSLTLEMVSVKFVVWVVITGLLPAVLIFFVRKVFAPLPLMAYTA